MATRAARPLALSCSSQPRRRLARRRKHLPTPVLRTRRVDDGVISVEPVDIRKLVTLPAQGDDDTLLFEAASESEIESVASA